MDQNLLPPEYVLNRSLIDARYPGVPIREKSYMFGDNKSVVDSSMQLDAKFHKQHTMLSFYCVREAIAVGILSFYFLSGNDNPADILSKHWGYPQIWERLKSLLFWRGDTSSIMDEKATFGRKGSDKISSLFGDF
jgi:hypothetical protein